MTKDSAEAGENLQRLGFELVVTKIHSILADDIDSHDFACSIEFIEAIG